MIQVTKFYARSFDLDHMDLFWELADFLPATDDILTYTFQVLRSESPHGPWTSISVPLKDIYHFRDTGPALLHTWRHLFYLLRITHQPTSEVTDVGPTTQDGEPDLIAMEITRQEDVLFRELIGRKCWLFPVRTFGPKCICYDRVTSRRTKSNCLTCFDTGYLGGYFSPIECFIQIDPATNTPTMGPHGEAHNQDTSGRLISFPPIKPKDILVEAENKRWVVFAVNHTQRLRAAVHQELSLHLLPVGDVAYKLPVNVDVATLSPAAERNFTNPQHTDGVVDVQNIMAVYNYNPRGVAT